MSLSSSSKQASLRVQITQIDHTLIQPGPLDNSSLPRVPVIRIYGTSSAGKKACLHVHQVYPYFFVEYSGKLTSSHVNRYISRLAKSLNHAIALSLKRNPLSPRAQYIRAILLVKGVHFYGFHSSYTPFLKICVADPALVARAAAILQSGTVMGMRFRVYESHLSYILQFMCDFGLYGCGWIDLEDVLQRDVQSTWEGEFVNPDSTGQQFNPSPYYRQTRMPLEVDAIAPHILNRHNLAARNLHHKLEIPAPPLPAEPVVLGVRELWEDERQRRAARGLNPSPEIPVDPSDSHRGLGGDWVAEAEWWEEIREKVERDREAERSLQPSLTGWENWVMTTFESVEALWEAPFRSWRPANGGVTEAVSTTPETSLCMQSQWNAPDEMTELEDNSHAVDVDITMLASQELSQLIRIEEAEWAQYGDQDRGFDEDIDPTTLEELDAIDEDQEEDEVVGSQNMAAAGHVGDQDPFELPHVADDTPIAMPSKEVEYKLSSPPDRPHMEHESQSPSTPTRARGTPKPLWPSESDSEDAEGPAAASQSSQTECSMGIVHDDALVQSACSSPISPLEPFHRDLILDASPPLDAIDDTPRPAKRRKLGFSTQDEEVPPPGFFFSSPSPFTGSIQQPPAVTVKLLRESYAVHTVKAVNMNRYEYAIAPPAASDLLNSLDDYDLPSRIYRPPYYSVASDVPGRPREYGGLLFHLKGGDGITHLDAWADSVQANVQPERPFPLLSTGIGGWEYASAPPSVREVKRWLAEGLRDSTRAPAKLKSQIEGPTQANIYGLKDTPGPGKAHQLIPRETQTMSVIALEVFALTQEGKALNANIDEIVAVFYAYQTSTANPPRKGTIIVQPQSFDHRSIRDIELDVVQNEVDLINRVIDLVGDLDPDIVTGWDVQRGSWGFLDARGRQHGFEVADLISRAPPTRSAGIDQWGLRRTSTFKVAGRHVLNLWRIMRSEHALTSYTLENIAFNVLHRRVPLYSNATLAEWYCSGVPFRTATVLRYFSDRTSMLLEILEESEVITRTAEFARVFGVDFFSVISRGSQFKVESFMFRIAKPESFVLISPSRRDVGRQNAAECMPLIMEPASAFYTSPLVVLDFQSLYPSIMIAYNYCYSTCLGRVKDFQGRNKFGVTDLQLPPGLLATLSDHVQVAPNGIMYVKPEVRKGLLGRMLIELLGTRVMVKQAMKGVENKALRRILDARQLGLKYIANVTYGYTSATFSGRMPAVEIADSIVQSGRETLEKAIKLINTTNRWGAEVVYGDTDSLFIHLRGKTKEQAFRIGHDIADTITALNPSPVKLKFEKVYFPCVLLAKKRYVGFKFERVDDEEPVFDAKGIETVRRDGVIAQQKMTETCLKILFRTQDLSEVKDYCCRSWTKLLENRASLRDFIFAKEVRMGTYSEKGPPPPGVVVAAKRMLQDPASEPQYGERVPYVIVRGNRGSRLVDRAMDPLEMLEDSHLQLDAVYYISRVLIPPLERIFNLVGADVRGWFDEMPKPRYLDPTSSPMKVKDEVESPDRLHIEEHFRSSQCLVCGSLASDSLCYECYYSPQETIAKLSSRIQAIERRLQSAHRICATCTGCAPGEPIKCESIDCPAFFSRKRAENQEDFLEIAEEILEDLNENVDAETDSDNRATPESDDSNDDYMDFIFQTPES
ncbi:putative DNA polymerase type-B family protein [Lyophyllum shimeji]|uniref:DNA polymerase n=1 Tax=Lyophyllum shimeji TaxID=47721 RepID=A0A9P3ULZ1_LYOSH|nr:putative DNA polymerase type-B family protein [Lyophyllum shimeji]